MIWDHCKTSRRDFIHSNTTEKKLATLQIPMSPLLVHKCKTIKFDIVEEITTSGYIQINLKIYYGIVSNHSPLFSETSQREWCKLVCTLGKSKLPNSQYLWDIILVFFRRNIWVLLELIHRGTQNFTIISQPRRNIKSNKFTFGKTTRIIM